MLRELRSPNETIRIGSDMTAEMVDYYGLWGTALLWWGLTSVFTLFLPFYRRRYRRTTFLFIVSSFTYTFEKYGFPLSRWLVWRVTGYRLPEGILWGHTLSASTGMAGHYLYLLFILVGGTLVVAGWARIYGMGPDGRVELVRTGVYRYLRHPQYTGLMLISLASILDWATLPLLIIWPVLVRTLNSLAAEEDQLLNRVFGGRWDAYAVRTGRFIPRVR